MPAETETRPVILTGDRTTGPLHLGHLAASLRNRVALRRNHRQFLLLADGQALTDHAHDPGTVRRNVLEVALDYLAVGIDPEQATICAPSCLPALAELTLLYLKPVTIARLERNPTIKNETRARGFGRGIPAGFSLLPRRPGCRHHRVQGERGPGRGGPRPCSSSEPTRSSAAPTGRSGGRSCPRPAP